MKLKRVLAFVLSFFMLMVSMPKFSAEASPFLTLDKDKYLINEPMKVTISGLTEAQIEDQSAYVGIHLKGDKENASSYNGIYTYVRDLRDGKTWDVNAPLEFGEYEIRLYWTEDGKEKNIESVPFTVTSSTAKDGDLKISKDNFLINENVTVTINGLTKEQTDDSAWVGLFTKGDDLKTSSYNGTYSFIRDLKDGKTWEFKAPAVYGDYEVRVFTKDVDEDKRAGALFGKLSFTVKSSQAKEGDLYIDKDKVTVNDNIIVKISGLTNGQIEDGAWAGLYNVGDAFKTGPYNGIDTYVKDLRDGKTWEFKAPTKYGNYEIRVFTKDVDPELREQALFGRLPFTVCSNPANPGDLKISKESYKMDEEIVVTITGILPGQVEDGAWAGLYSPSDAFKTDPFNGISVNVKDLADGKTWKFKAPSTPGVYEIRVYTQDIEPDFRELAFFGRLPFTIINQKYTVPSKGGFSWNNYKLKVVPDKQVVIAKNKTYKLRVTAIKAKQAPVPANVLATYISSNKKIATVDKTGVIKGISKGTAYITVKGGKQAVRIKVIIK